MATAHDQARDLIGGGAGVRGKEGRGKTWKQSHDERKTHTVVTAVETEKEKIRGTLQRNNP